ncbi:SDR family NAD(P)-dependent oxidoreductase [Glycomyces sp. NPDC046736]|uniref:SDR family NAD(P)-dependent oxidoreductase n=1 Tax=Glycomyces sp. NPDC046736 TaxID=3155615 RepID=UPI00340C4648
MSEPHHPRTVVISGGTDGMGRALALARAARGDRVVAIGSNADKGTRLLAEANGRVEFLQADLSSVAETKRVIDTIAENHTTVDGLCLFANRQSPKRTETPEGLERTFALYYLSRHLLGRGLGPLLGRSRNPVIVNVAGVGMTKGEIHWDDLQLSRGYGMIAAQLQAGRANDLLGVAYAAEPAGPAKYVLYHPGFTKSGDLSPLPAAGRVLLRLAAGVAAHSVERSVAPIHGFLDRPPAARLTANDRGRELPLTLPTLNRANASRLAEATAKLLAEI